MYKEKDFAHELCEVIKNGNPVADKNGAVDIWLDYHDRLSQKEIAGLFRDNPDYEGDTPRERFNSLVDLRVDDYICAYENETYKDFVHSYMSDEANEYWNEDTDSATDIMREYLYFRYPADRLDTEVCVNILLDTGNGKYDFSLDDVLTAGGQFHEESSLLFLAKTQGKEDALKTAVAAYGSRKTETDPFVESCLEELENTGSGLNTVTFCVKMTLFKLLDLWESVFENPDENSCIVVTKDARTGLFNPFDGGGSLFEIHLEKDAEIPARYIYSIAPDGRWDIPGHWDVGTTYGVVSSFWNGTSENKEN